MTDPILIAKNASHELVLLPQLANRHGLITGATGTGKTVTLQTLAQGLSKLGVPVFLADVKGDLTGISQPGQPNDKLKARLKSAACPSRSGPVAPSPCGMCTASAATPCVPPCPTWAR
jgi:hypothetical protein